MSKYFDETLKLNESPFTAGAPSSSAKPRFSRASSSDGSCILQLGNEQNGKIALAQTLRQQFTEWDSMGTFQESYRVLRTRLLRLQSERGLRSVVVTSSTKGEGKSAVSLNLAFSCAQLPELKVLLIDSDIRSGGLSRMLEAPMGQGLSGVLSQKIEPSEAILATDLPNLYFLPCDSTPIPPAELLASRRWAELIASCCRTFSLVIVDAPPVLNLTDADLIAAPCDGVLMVVRSQHTRVDFLQRAHHQIDSKKLIGVVLNGAAGERGTYTYSHVSAVTSPLLSRIPILSRLFGGNGSEKPKNGSLQVPPSEPANPGLPPEVATDDPTTQPSDVALPSEEGS